MTDRYYFEATVRHETDKAWCFATKNNPRGCWFAKSKVRIEGENFYSVEANLLNRITLGYQNAHLSTEAYNETWRYIKMLIYGKRTGLVTAIKALRDSKHAPWNIDYLSWKTEYNYEDLINSVNNNNDKNVLLEALKTVRNNLSARRDDQKERLSHVSTIKYIDRILQQTEKVIK